MVCFRCNSENVGPAKFCLYCGAPLELNLFLDEVIESKLKAALDTRFQESKTVQTEWVATSVEKLASWLKLFAFFVGVPVGIFLLILGAVGYSNYREFTNTVDTKLRDFSKTADQKQTALGSAELHAEGVLKSLTASSAELETRFKPLVEKLPQFEAIAGRLNAVQSQFTSFKTDIARVSQRQDQLTTAVDQINVASPDRNLNDLQPRVKDLAIKLIEAAAGKGIPIMIIETCRTQERQDYLFGTGATKFRKVAAHGYGLAFDVAKRDANGKASWTGSFDEIGRLGSNLGLIWGGDWGKPGTPSIYKDPNHFQSMQLSDQEAAFKTAKPCTPGGTAAGSHP